MRDARRRVRQVVDRLIGPVAAGRLDELRHPASGPPLNGQTARTAMMDELIAAVAPTHAVETGTFTAATTRWLARRLTPAPVFTVESEPRWGGRARQSLRRERNVTATIDDSRSFLRELFDGDALPAGRGLYYLDAHWYDDLPLPEELAIIAERASDPVIVVDDMEVPGDDGYGFDDYGPGRRLDAGLLESALAGVDARVWYPSTPATDETGHRQGCCVIALTAATGTVLDGLGSLRP